jgi:hypothetical protein
MSFRPDLAAIEDTARLLYIRALKVLPDDIKQGFRRLGAQESDRRPVHLDPRQAGQSDPYEGDGEDG